MTTRAEGILHLLRKATDEARRLVGESDVQVPADIFDRPITYAEFVAYKRAILEDFLGECSEPECRGNHFPRPFSEWEEALDQHEDGLEIAGVSAWRQTQGMPFTMQAAIEAEPAVGDTNVTLLRTEPGFVYVAVRVADVWVRRLCEKLGTKLEL